jgi:hypothetical protein
MSASFSASGPSSVHRRAPSWEQNGPQVAPIGPKVVTVPGAGAGALMGTSSPFILQAVFNGIVIALIAAMAITFGLVLSYQGKQLKQIKVNNTAQQMQIAEILMDMTTHNLTFRQNGTFQWGGTSTSFINSPCTVTGISNYTVYDVTIENLLPFVVIFLGPPQVPIVFDDASCGGAVTNSFDVYAVAFDPVVEELTALSVSGVGFLLSSYNVAIIPPCESPDCTLAPSYIYGEGYVYNTGSVSFRYQNLNFVGSALPLTWTFNASTPLRISLPLA